jgi:SAM-dependent methyltransferase
MTTDKPMSTGPDFWNARYTEAGFAYGEAANVYLAAVAERIKPRGRVLVPGDGEGRNGVWLAQQGFAVTTVDISEVGCAKAAALASRHGVAMDVLCADLAAWKWPVGSFDAVVSIFLHLPPQIRPTLHGRMRDALTPAGVLIIEAFAPEHLPLRLKNPSVGGPDQADMLYSLETLRADFAPLQALIFEQVDIELAEGRYHAGLASVVRAVFAD